jgi:prenylcysteine oxidase/farnesylcysteine lyase
VVTTKEDGWWEKAKLLWRYGLAPIRTNSLMKSTVAKFLRMYEEPVFPWKSLSEVVARMGLSEITGVTGEQFLKANGIGEKFSKEVIQARYVYFLLYRGITFVWFELGWDGMGWKKLKR